VAAVLVLHPGLLTHLCSRVGLGELSIWILEFEVRACGFVCAAPESVDDSDGVSLWCL
jgi:hypothetical protein